MYYEIDCELTRTENGRINGVKLSAKPQTEAIEFCATFPKALFKDGTADIVFEDNKIVFKHPKGSFPGEFSVELDPKDAEELKGVISPANTISLEQWSAWGGGFRLYVKNIT